MQQQLTGVLCFIATRSQLKLCRYVDVMNLAAVCESPGLLHTSAAPQVTSVLNEVLCKLCAEVMM